MSLNQDQAVANNDHSDGNGHANPDDDNIDNDLPVGAYGVHSDLFENCFSVKMSASDHLYRAPGSITKSDAGPLFGPLLVPVPSALPAESSLAAHADDAVHLDQFYQQSPHSEIFILLYDNWNA
jgi:hypothetical protein